MEKFLAIIITILLVRTVFAQEGPIYNFHFHNGSPVATESAPTVPMAPVNETRVDPIKDMIGSDSILSVEFGLRAVGSDDTFYSYNGDTTVESDDVAPHLTLIMKLSDRIKFKVFGAVTSYSGYTDIFEDNEWGGYYTTDYYDGEVFSLGVGLQAEQRLSRYFSLISSLNFTYSKGTLEVDQWVSNEGRSDPISVSRLAFGISVGPQLNIGKTFYTNIQGILGAGETKYGDESNGITMTFGGILNVGMRI